MYILPFICINKKKINDALTKAKNALDIPRMEEIPSTPRSADINI